MTKKKSRRLVVDANIIGSAGGEDTDKPHDPRSKNSRDCLQAILDIGHRIVMTPDIKKEWNKHQSRFARIWRRKMASSRKVWKEKPPINQALREIIDNCRSENDEWDMRKDVHLIEAALVTDKVVFSLDKAAEGLFAGVSNDIRELKGIVWINPDKDADNLIDWLKSKYDFPAECRLGYNA